VLSKSRTPADTRTGILEAALRRMDRSKGADAATAEIADAAGVSRQALYLHFADRSKPLIAVAHHVDARRGLGAKLQAISNVSNGLAAMQAMVAMQAEDNPSLRPLARTFEAARRTDRAAEKSWQDRLNNRLAVCRSIVARMHAEASLRRGLNADTAASMLWTLTSLRMWECLVAQRGWSGEQYRTQGGALLLGALGRQ
jgi:AcrR family transcriptional regulator